MSALNLSPTLSLYKKWIAGAEEKQIKHVNSVYKLAEKNYENGGDQIVECFNPQEIMEMFPTLKSVKEYCGLKIDQALDARFREDSDTELVTAENFNNNWK